jgi:MFS family permease
MARFMLPQSSAPAPGFGYLLGGLLAAQTVGTVATMILPAAAPKVAQTYGVDSSLIGYQISVLAAAMIFALVFCGNWSVRWGGCRVTQAGVALLAAGSVIATLPHVAFLFVASIALGLGYGLLSPSASHLLMRFTPPKRRNLIFSLKQTGVPLGGIAAALVTPAVAVAFGWQWALIGNAVLLITIIIMLERGRAHWDNDRQPAAQRAFNPFGGIATVWRHRPLRLLSIAGGCLVVVQISISTFTVVLFAEEMAYTLIQAGFVLTASQVGGVAGRIFWGWAADLVHNCYTVLAVLTAVMLVAALACYAITPAWPIVASSLLFFVFGSTASGWNGAFMAEVARLAPAQAVSSATGGSLFFVNIGKMLGPIILVYAYALAGSYSAAFALLGIPAAIGLLCLLSARSMPAAAGATRSA